MRQSSLQEVATVWGVFCSVFVLQAESRCPRREGHCAKWICGCHIHKKPPEIGLIQGFANSVEPGILAILHSHFCSMVRGGLSAGGARAWTAGWGRTLGRSL